MEKKTIKQNANNILWVEYWIQNADSSLKDYRILAERYEDNRWVCEITLPIIKQSVKAISNKEVSAMLNASKKAAKLIDQYAKEHPELKITNEFKGKRWEIVSNESGKVISIGMSSAWRRDQGKQMEKNIEESLKTIKKAIVKLAKINGTSKNLFIQVLDKSLFNNEKSVEDIMHKVMNKIEEDYQTSNMTISCNEDEDSVIALGYAFPLKKDI